MTPLAYHENTRKKTSAIHYQTHCSHFSSTNSALAFKTQWLSQKTSTIQVFPNTLLHLTRHLTQ